MNVQQNNYKDGIGLGGFMFLIFLTLKLLGFITWSWWWVTAPLWIPAAIVIIILLILAFAMLMK